MSRRWWLIGALAITVIGMMVVPFVLNLRPSSGTSPSAPGASTSTQAPGSTPAASSASATSSSPSPAPQSVVPPVSGEMQPVDIKASSRRPSGVIVTLSAIESVEGQAVLPGEVAAPAVRVTVVLKNEGSAAVSLGSVVVNGYSGSERTPLESLVSPGGEPFAGSLPPGAEAKGVYLFSVPVARRGDLTITVDPKAGEPVSVLRGDASR